MKKILLFTLWAALIMPKFLSAQELLPWIVLSDVQYQPDPDNPDPLAPQLPIFGYSLKQINATEVLMRGYTIPLDVGGESYALSENPYASCFFCGGGSRESILELQLRDYSRKYKIDEILTFKGKLILNQTGMGLNYILTDAEPVEE